MGSYRLLRWRDAMVRPATTALSLTSDADSEARAYLRVRAGVIPSFASFIKITWENVCPLARPSDQRESALIIIPGAISGDRIALTPDRLRLYVCVYTRPSSAITRGERDFSLRPSRSCESRLRWDVNILLSTRARSISRSAGRY